MLSYFSESAEQMSDCWELFTNLRYLRSASSWILATAPIMIRSWTRHIILRGISVTFLQLLNFW